MERVTGKGRRAAALIDRSSRSAKLSTIAPPHDVIPPPLGSSLWRCPDHREYSFGSEMGPWSPFFAVCGVFSEWRRGVVSAVSRVVVCCLRSADSSLLPSRRLPVPVSVLFSLLFEHTGAPAAAAPSAAAPLSRGRTGQ
jgi:hypothetical protein